MNDSRRQETRRRTPIPRHLKRLLIVSYTVSAIFAIILLFSDRGLGELRRLEAEADALDQQIAELRQENARLEKELENIAEPSLRLERIAREELGLVREGEIVLILPTQDQRPPADRTDSGDLAETPGPIDGEG